MHFIVLGSRRARWWGRRSPCRFPEWTSSLSFVIFFTIFFFIKLDPAAGQLVEHLVVELLVRLLAPHQQEDVPADEFVNDLQKGGGSFVIMLEEIDRIEGPVCQAQGGGNRHVST